VLRSRPIVLFCWMFGVGMIAAFLAVAASGPGPDPGPADYVVTLVVGAVLSLPFLRATRMKVVLNDQGVTVFRILSTESIPWSELSDVSVDYGGLRLLRVDHQVVTAASMGKPNWATWLHRRVTADERVEIIRHEMLRHRPGHGS
jgi:hypothetical protein